MDSSTTEEPDKQVLYLLDIRMPDSPPQRIQVQGKLVLGQHEESDVHIKGRGLLSKHAIFRLNNDVLSMHNFSPETELNEKPLATGRMYILDKGDKLVMGQIEIIIRRDEVGEHELDVPKTSVQSILKYKEELEKTKGQKSDGQGLFGKIKGFFKKDKSKESILAEEIDKTPVKHKKGENPHYKAKTVARAASPGPLLRALGLPGTLSTIYLILFGLLPWQKMDGLVFEHEKMALIEQFLKQKIGLLITSYPNLKPYFDLISDSLTPHLMAFALAFITLEICSHLLLGASFGHVLVGIETQDSLVIKRLKALGRLILWPLSCATVIGELLPLVRMRTLKEILTASRPHPANLFRRFLGCCLLLPIIVLLAPVSALFLDPDFWEGPWEVVPPPVRQDHTDVPKIETVFFSATIQVPNNPDLVLLPLINLEKVTESSLILLDVKKGQQVQIKRWNPPKFSFDGFALANPVLPFLYPEFKKTIETDLALQEKILGYATSIQVNNFLDYTLEFGPFTYGLTKLRQQFKDSFELHSRPEVFRLDTGKDHLWAIKESEIKERNQIIIWNPNPLLPSLKLEHNKESTGFATSTISKILRAMQFKSGLKLTTQTNLNLTESSLFIMDYMLETPQTEALSDIQRVTSAMKIIKDALPKEGRAQKAWHGTKDFLHTRWMKLVPNNPKDKTATKNWQKALDDFKKL